MLITEVTVNEVKLSGYLPGAIGRIVELHATYYNQHWEFDLRFESQVATELSEFLLRFDETRDGFWVAIVDSKIVGSVAIDGRSSPDARLIPFCFRHARFDFLESSPSMRFRIQNPKSKMV